MRHGALLQAVVLTTMAVFLTSCSRNPVAPTVDPSVSPGAGTTVISQVPEDPPPSDGGTPTFRQVTLVATDEGVISVGRWTLWLRKNTLTMPATITMSVTDPEAMNVHIVVSPPEANAFQSPAVLTANLSDVDGVDYSNETMFYWTTDWTQSSSASAHPNQQNVVNHMTTLTDCMVGTGNGKKKIGA